MKELGPIKYDGAFYKIYLQDYEDVSIYSNYSKDDGFWSFIGSGKHTFVKGLHDWVWAANVIVSFNIPSHHTLEKAFKEKIEMEIGLFKIAKK